MSGNFLPKDFKTTKWSSDWDVNTNQYLEISDTVSEASHSSTDEKSNIEVGNAKQRLRKLFEDQLYTDVLFYPMDNPSISISGHKALLAVGSPLFAAMLFGDNTNDNNGKKMKVKISNISFAAFENIVKYLYTDDIFFESDELVQDILEGATTFKIPSLVSRCKSFFDSQVLTDQNVCSKLQISTTNKLEVLKSRCIEYIQKNTYKVVKSPDFLKCSISTLRTICKLQSLNLHSEIELLEAVINWLDSQPPVIRKQQLEPLLKCIRFLTLTVSELSCIIKNYPNLLTSDDGLQIMVYLSNPPKIPNFKTIPSWCNKNTIKRCVFIKDTAKLQIGNNQPEMHLTRKLSFPLKGSIGDQNFSELTSLLQMTCIMGSHEITAIRLSFQGPVTERSIIKSLIISINRFPAVFKSKEIIEVVNSLDVRIPLRRVVKIRHGDRVDIEIDAKNIQFYKFLQFDENCDFPQNPHFKCCVASHPRIGRWFFIREVEYKPQESRRATAKFR